MANSRLIRTLLALLLSAALAATVVPAHAQPVGGDTLTGGQLEIVEEPIQVWVADSTEQNPQPDTFYVHDAADGQYWRSKIDAGAGYYYRCPVPGDVFNLGATQSALSGFSSNMESVVKNGATPSLPPVVARAECVERYSATLDSLLSILDGREKPVTYATECRATVDNGTVHVPASTSFSGIEPEPGDTVAVYSPAGTCVGQGTWTPEGATLAAAMTDDVLEEIWPNFGGLSPGQPMTFEIYKQSEDRAFRPSVTFASCDTVGVPICKDENGAMDGAFFEVAKLNFDPLS